MTLDEMVQQVERDLPGWGWLVRSNRNTGSVRTDDTGTPRPDWTRGQYYANITTPSFHYTDKVQLNETTGETYTYNEVIGEPTSFPRYSNISATDALLAAYVWALETRAEFCPGGTSDKTPADISAVERVQGRFPGLLADGRPEMPENYEADLSIRVIPSRRPR